MKYLVHLRPPADFRRDIEGFQRRLGGFLKNTPGPGLHCTLMSAYFRPEHEARILDSLAALRFSPFSAATGQLALFDDDCLVVRLKPTLPLQRLHEAVITALADLLNWAEIVPYAGPPSRRRVFERFGSPYAAEYYNPHITVGKVDSAVLKDPAVFHEDLFAGRTLDFAETYVSKKADAWREVGRFPAG